MIKLTSIGKQYVRNKVEKVALDDINLQVQRGEFVAITGPSGCGKSTLLNVLGMMDMPTSGQYLLDNLDVYARSEKQLVELRNRDIGFIFQNFNLLESPSVFENVELPLVYRKTPKAERHARVTEVLERLGLGECGDLHPTELSGGEQQRVAVARALVGDPKLILADEPTGNLDSKAGDKVLSLLKSLHERGATILMVTHSSEYASRADRAITMLDGRIVRPA
ncbi:MAG TPA: ABC transporter ATP-binding protein [Steroidobacteraceae bacterium]|nr:ABC transporter ATP-binding protein [Steroidobacteraceae bacterium]